MNEFECLENEKFIILKNRELMIDLLHETCLKGLNCLCFFESLFKEDLVQKLLLKQAEIDINQNLTKEDYKLLVQAIPDICNWGLYVEKLQTLTKTNNKIKKLKPDCVFIESEQDITAQKLCRIYKLDFHRMFKGDTEKKLTRKTVRNHHIVIHLILSTAVDWNILMNNPAERAKPQKVTKPKARYYNDEQVAEMLNALSSESLMYMTMIYLAIDIGLREGELTGLKWEDINFNTCEISINKQRHYIAGIGDVEGKPKTDAGMRIVTASKTVISLLKEYKKQQTENRLKFGMAWQNGEYVFLHEDGKPISTQRPYKWFTNFLKRHNLPKITFHQLRHTNASLLISSGEDIVTVSGRLGHADKNVTLNTYSHIIKSKEAQVANKMDEFYERLKIINN